MGDLWVAEGEELEGVVFELEEQALKGRGVPIGVDLFHPRPESAQVVLVEEDEDGGGYGATACVPNDDDGVAAADAIVAPVFGPVDVDEVLVCGAAARSNAAFEASPLLPRSQSSKVNPREATCHAREGPRISGPSLTMSSSLETLSTRGARSGTARARSIQGSKAGSLLQAEARDRSMVVGIRISL